MWLVRHGEPALAGSTPKHTHSRRALLGVSATTFLAPGDMKLGPDRAVFLLTVVAVVAGWFFLCPALPDRPAISASPFSADLMSGLIGGRSYYTPPLVASRAPPFPSSSSRRAKAVKIEAKLAALAHSAASGKMCMPYHRKVRFRLSGRLHQTGLRL